MGRTHGGVDGPVSVRPVGALRYSLCVCQAVCVLGGSCWGGKGMQPVEALWPGPHCHPSAGAGLAGGPGRTLREEGHALSHTGRVPAVQSQQAGHIHVGLTWRATAHARSHGDSYVCVALDSVYFMTFYSVLS